MSYLVQLTIDDGGDVIWNADNVKQCVARTLWRHEFTPHIQIRSVEIVIEVIMEKKEKVGELKRLMRRLARGEPRFRLSSFTVFSRKSGSAYKLHDKLNEQFGCSKWARTIVLGDFH